jgi:hypothetical protein
MIFAIILFSFIELNAQIKIGELNNSNGVITHNLPDLIQALEKEYDISQGTTFKYVKILVSNNNKYWLVAGNVNPSSHFKIAVSLEKNTSNNSFYISRVNDVNVEKCSDCSEPNCALMFDKSGQPDGCATCSTDNSKQFCNHSKGLSKNSKQVPVEKFFKIKN